MTNDFACVIKYITISCSEFKANHVFLLQRFMQPRKRWCFSFHIRLVRVSSNKKLKQGVPLYLIDCRQLFQINTTWLKPFVLHVTAMKGTRTVWFFCLTHNAVCLVNSNVYSRVSIKMYIVAWDGWFKMWYIATESVMFGNSISLNDMQHFVNMTTSCW